jgi:hypothetical protein
MEALDKKASRYFEVDEIAECAAMPISIRRRPTKTRTLAYLGATAPL